MAFPYIHVYRPYRGKKRIRNYRRKEKGEVKIHNIYIYKEIVLYKYIEEKGITY